MEQPSYSSLEEADAEVPRSKWGKAVWQQFLATTNKDVVEAINGGMYVLLSGKEGKSVEDALTNLIEMARTGYRGVIFILLVADSGDIGDGVRGYQFLQRAANEPSLRNAPFIILSERFASKVLDESPVVAAPHILVVDGERTFCRDFENKWTKKLKGSIVGFKSDTVTALADVNELSIDERNKIKLVLIDIGRLGGETAFLDAIKQIIPQASMVVTVPIRERAIGFTEQIINAGAVMVMQKPCHQLFVPFLLALM